MLGLLSDEDFLDELSRLNGTNSTGEIRARQLGRGSSKEVSESVRQLIAETAIESSAPNKEVAQAFGVSHQSVAAYKNGATSLATYNDSEPKLKRAVNAKQESIRNSAHDKIIDALKAITPAKLEDAGVKTAAAVARDMSAVIKNLTPEVEQKDNQVNFVIFAPPIKTEDDYNPAFRVDE